MALQKCVDGVMVDMTPDEEAAIRAEWAAADAPAPVVVPASVTNFQARAALIAAGLFDQVDAAVHSSGDALATQAWEYANNVYRQSSLIAQLGTALGLTEPQIDALFIAAAAIDT